MANLTSHLTQKSIFLCGAVWLALGACNTYKSRIRYADEISQIDQACNIQRNINDIMPGLRDFSSYEAPEDVQQRAVQSISQTTPLDEVRQEFMNGINNGSIERSEELSEWEQLAIYTYTRRGDGYYNKALREGLAEYSEWKDVIFTISSGLNKLINHRMTDVIVYRGEKISEDLYKKLSQLTPNDTILGEYGFTSATTWLGFAEGFAVGEYQALYKIKSKTGVSIDHLSAMTGEDEVLFVPGRQFRLKSVTPTKVGPKQSGSYDAYSRLIIELEEI